MRGEAGVWLAGVALVLLGLGVPVGFAGILYTAEQNDAFCVACHLHEEKFARFQAGPSATDLAGAHHAREAARCIDCHGGADLLMRLRVWAVAGFDTVRFLSGRYEEPRRMRLPLRDAECRRCHTPILRETAGSTETPGPGATSFHGIPDHRTVKTACVACHTSHTLGEKRRQFVDPRAVRPLCRECHESMGADASG
jgi:predicted CXXCH cytochrome family protein